MSKKARILVVDDNEEFCQNMKDIVELQGYEVLTAHDGFQALELVRQNGLDLVLMDVRMPVMDGVATFKKIKQIAPQLPVIMVTAYAVEQLVRDALRQGAFGFLRKPLDFELLFAVIESAVSKGALVLVVDDDRDLCANMKDVLSDRGYRVSVAHDGSTAIEKAWESDFDVILLDMKLPPLNGLETYFSVRDIRLDVVVIIITGHRQEMGDLVEQAIRETAYTCLEKPIDMDELFSLLEQIMERKGKGIPKKSE
ncbi:MAG: response regulator [Dehalococcoidia bacterium]|nr:MAG: response regulator [Dehalococcoidia bacterium]